MTTEEQKKKLKDFVKRWKGRGYEKGETQQFWIQLLRDLGYEYVDSILFEDQLENKGYLEPDSEESMHALNVLCVRLVFCLYCEDADLFEKDSFLQYLKGTAPGDVRLKLKTLFRALDTDRPFRDPYDTTLKVFPYVNGGLFKEEVEIPNFSQEALDFLLDEVSAPIDWSRISPTIFGGIFESTLNPETHRSGGMHYTSPENIHKVIDPLFLDDLWEEFRGIKDNEDLTPRQKDNRYKKFHKKLCSLTFFESKVQTMIQFSDYLAA